MTESSPAVALNPAMKDQFHPKRTILIYSPDMNFCFSLAGFFQDRYDVITTTDPKLLGPLSMIRSASLVIVDEEPSIGTIERLRELRTINSRMPVIMLYVFDPRGGEMEKAVRDLVNLVFYKPLNVHEVSGSVRELIGD